jgi:hypothetical protein
MTALSKQQIYLYFYTIKRSPGVIGHLLGCLAAEQRAEQRLSANQQAYFLGVLAALMQR